MKLAPAALFSLQNDSTALASDDGFPGCCPHCGAVPILFSGAPGDKKRTATTERLLFRIAPQLGPESWPVMGSDG